MKRLWQLVISCLLALMCLPANADVIGGIDFPHTLGGFELRFVIDNEKSNPGLGVTLFYNTTGVKVSIFVYDHSKRNIPEGTDSSVIHKEFAEARSNVQQVYPDAQILVREQRFLVGRVALLHSAFTYTEVKVGSRETVFSHLYLAARRGNFVKVRATYSATNRPELGNRTQIQFIDALCQLLVNLQTGKRKRIESDTAKVPTFLRKPSPQKPKSSRAIPQKTILYAQALLSQLEYDPGPIDGILGERTRKAIRTFQREIGLPATGRIDAALNGKLESAVELRESPVITKPKIARTKPRTSKKIPHTSHVLHKIPDALLFHPLKPEDIFRKVQNSVFIILAAKSVEALKDGVGISQGSAVAVSSNHLLTNCHVIRNQPFIFAIKGKQMIAAQLSGKDENRDTCVLTIKGHKIAPIVGVKKFENLNVGEKVYTVGAPIGLEQTLGEGIISGLREYGDLKLIQTSAPISSGSSGGGLFDASGNLIGITTFLLKDAQNLNFAIAAEKYWK